MQSRTALFFCLLEPKSAVARTKLATLRRRRRRSVARGVALGAADGPERQATGDHLEMTLRNRNQPSAPCFSFNCLLVYLVLLVTNELTQTERFEMVEMVEMEPFFKKNDSTASSVAIFNVQSYQCVGSVVLW